MNLQQPAAPFLPASGVSVSSDLGSRLAVGLRRVGLALIRLRLRSVLHGFTDHDLRRLGQNRDEIERWLDEISPR